MNAERIKVKFNGTVKANFKDADSGKRVLYIGVSAETAQRIEDRITSAGFEWDGNNFPVKANEDDEPYVKVSTKFDTYCSDYELDEIGKESEVCAYIVIKPGKYGRKRYVSAFVTGIDVQTFVRLEEYNPFEDDEFQEA